jgi:hypothetical protein
MNDDLQIKWDEAAVTLLQVLRLYLSAETEENNEDTQYEYPVS